MQSKAQLLQARLKDIGYAQPSNFTGYCRQYLGADYFDQLTESESESDDEDSSLGDEDEGSDSTGRSGTESDSQATAVDEY